MVRIVEVTQRVVVFQILWSLSMQFAATRSNVAYRYLNHLPMIMVAAFCINNAIELINSLRKAKVLGAEALEELHKDIEEASAILSTKGFNAK